MDTKKLKALAASWGRSFLAAALTAYMAGATNPEDLLKAGLIAVLPVIIRWLNPNDEAFGRTKK